MCGSFLTIRDDYVYLIHQSVKDYLEREGVSSISISLVSTVYYAILARSL